MLPIILDCDPGVDDAIAILYASRRTKLLAITTVFGNASVAHTTRNALRLCDLAGLDVPVAQGCGAPLLGRYESSGFHGLDGLDGALHLPDPARQAFPKHATEMIIETARACPGKVALVATGPLTNVALALRLEPDLAKWLSCISIMGGSTDVGNETPFAESNIFRDPEAAEIVFSSGLNVMMAGLNLTRQTQIDRRLTARLRACLGPVQTVVASMLESYISRYESRGGGNWAPMHDPTAILALTRPDLIQYRALPVFVQLSSSMRGMTAVDLRGYLSPPATLRDRLDAQVGVAIDAPQAVAEVFDQIAAW